ncbi:MAG: hypothetical protein AAFY15_03475 [Cyanobacteria bacterium J06648_11]
MNAMPMSFDATSASASLAIADSPIAGIYNPHSTVATHPPGFASHSETVLMASLLPSQTTGVRSAIVTQPVVAQQYDQDVMGDIGKGWNNFVESGQIWACLIGAVLGYLLRSITS